MTLFLFPNTLGSRQVKDLSPAVGEAVGKIHGLIAESDKGGRSFLKLWGIQEVHKVPLALLPKRALTVKDCEFYLAPILENGENWGVVSDAGLPCIADPGASLVAYARKKGLIVKGFSGPCSVTLSLLLSGLPGQEFSFLGYLPKDPKERSSFFSRVLKTARGTQIFIETPYRNVHAFKSAIDNLPDKVLFSVASGLSTEEEFVATRLVSEWRRSLDFDEVLEKIAKVPSIFLFYIPK